MKKKFLTVMTVAAIMTAAMGMTAFAAGWQQNATGWWYGTNADNSQWYSNGWQWIDGNGDGTAECYYFDANGYMAANATTPDGYQVNADGAWTVNGTVQSKNVTATQPAADSDVKSTSVYDEETGISLAALDMLYNTREENAKYGEVSEMKIADQICVTYANGLNVFYWVDGKYGWQADSVQCAPDTSKLWKYDIESLEAAANLMKSKGIDAYTNSPDTIISFDNARIVMDIRNMDKFFSVEISPYTL